MNKKLVAYDSLNNRDLIDILSSSLRTSIDIRDPETGNIIFKGLQDRKSVV